MKLTKDTVASSELPDDIKSDLMELFGLIDTKENELAEIRKKVPTDSQKVVETVDHEKFLAATKELEYLKKKVESALIKEGSEEGDTMLSAFRSFFA